MWFQNRRAKWRKSEKSPSSKEGVCNNGVKQRNNQEGESSLSNSSDEGEEGDNDELGSESGGGGRVERRREGDEDVEDEGNDDDEPDDEETDVVTGARDDNEKANKSNDLRLAKRRPSQSNVRDHQSSTIYNNKVASIETSVIEENNKVEQNAAKKAKIFHSISSLLQPNELSQVSLAPNLAPPPPASSQNAAVAAAAAAASLGLVMHPHYQQYQSATASGIGHHNSHLFELNRSLLSKYQQNLAAANTGIVASSKENMCALKT